MLFPNSVESNAFDALGDLAMTQLPLGRDDDDDDDGGMRR